MVCLVGFVNLWYFLTYLIQVWSWCLWSFGDNSFKVNLCWFCICFFPCWVCVCDLSFLYLGMLILWLFADYLWDLCILLGNFFLFGHVSCLLNCFFCRDLCMLPEIFVFGHVSCVFTCAFLNMAMDSVVKLLCLLEFVFGVFTCDHWFTWGVFLLLVESFCA